MGVSCSHFRCRPGTFNLQPHNPAGCSSCFCYGHSKVCTAAAGFRVHGILSDFRQGKESPRSHPQGVSPSPGGVAILLWAILQGWVGGGKERRPPKPRHLPWAHRASLAAQAGYRVSLWILWGDFQSLKVKIVLPL